MESVYAGWLSIIPAVVAIGLALLTKQVILSLVVGICSGTLIYSAFLGQNLIIGTITNTIQILLTSVDFSLLLVLGMLGAFMYLLELSGGQHALGQWMAKRVKGKKGALLVTAVVSCFLFISDAFHVLAMGAICRPLCDEAKVSRSKLAYMLDATSAPTCCIGPVGTWVAGICACFPATALFSNNISVFFQQIPYNIYCITCILMVFWISFPNHDYGPMLQHEKDMEGDVDDTAKSVDYRVGKVCDMLIPLIILVAGTVFFMLWTGGLWTENRGIFDAFSNAYTMLSICSASLVAIVVMFIMYVPAKTVSFKEFMDGISMGVDSMSSICTLMVFAWGIGGTCRQLLQTGPFVADLISGSSFPLALLPAIFFIIAALLSFATGTSWGTFGIMLPLAFPICELAAPHLIVICISAVLGGSTFGDHCSPISDSTILSSAVAKVEHMVHVETQLPYALTSASAAIIGYLIAGFTANVFLTLAVSIVYFFIAVYVLSKRANRAYVEQ